MSPTVLIYRKDSGESRLIYRATLTDFLDTGEWTIEKPSNATPAPELKKSLLPTAGREANRPASEEVKADVSIKTEAKLQEEEAPEAIASSKRAPRRRVAQPKTEE